MPPRTFYTSVAPLPLYNFNTSGSTRSASAPNLLISTESHGIQLRVISPGGTMWTMSPEHPEFDNIFRAAIDVADGYAPRLSVDELHINPILTGEKRDAILVNPDGRETMLFVEIFSGHAYRFKAINDILQSVDAGALHSDKCGICMEPYDTAITADTFNDHKTSKLPKCGHVFGRHCITNWLELNV
ncbi:hypothetical protein OCU04_010361 [Sclerotinia nivalis]|uniref:Zinc finger RING-H2-type domain-containing protein n=1 Tax=Sclerotinia nivalis TaxID=352851 RepID=A0A9X0AFK3_9HELO|nr:hypothetical protein OCU04_010361 [Sclerotinia nivalis]